MHYTKSLCSVILVACGLVWLFSATGCHSTGSLWPWRTGSPATAPSASSLGTEPYSSAGGSTSGVIPASATEPVASSATASGGPQLGDPAGTSRRALRNDDAEAPSPFSWNGIVESLKELTGQDTNEAVAQALYDEGMELYRQKRFPEAAKRFERAAQRAPKSRLQEDALFMAGESWFFADRYPAAFTAYERLLKAFDYTRHLDTVVSRQFSIGRYWEQLNKADPAWLFSFQWSDPTRPKLATMSKAIEAYRSVRLHDPTGPLADDAVMATANAYFVQGRFEEAAYEYDLLRKEYPKSEHLLDAYLLGVQAKLQSYEGPWYDGTPLTEAREIAEQALLVFGDELGAERQRVIEQLNRMEELFAERDLVLGQFYEKKQCYGAARLYYQAVIDEHPTTQAAEQARQRLEAIRQYPDEPSSRFQWLIDMFPSGK